MRRSNSSYQRVKKSRRKRVKKSRRKQVKKSRRTTPQQVDRQPVLVNEKNNFYKLMIIILENPDGFSKFHQIFDKNFDENLEKIRGNVSSYDNNIDDINLFILAFFSSLAYNNELLQHLIINVIMTSTGTKDFNKDDLKTLLGLVLKIEDNVVEITGGVDKFKGGFDSATFQMLQLICVSLFVICLFYWTKQSTENSVRTFYNSETYKYSQIILPFFKDSELFKSCRISSDINPNYYKLLGVLIPESENTKKAMDFFALVSGQMDCISRSPYIQGEYQKQMQSYYELKPTSALQLTDIPEKASENALALIPTENSLVKYIEPVKISMGKAQENFIEFINREMRKPNFDKYKFIESLSKMSEGDILEILKEDNENSSSLYDYAMKIGKSFAIYSLENPSFSPLKQYAIELHNMFIDLNTKNSILQLKIESDLSKIKNEIILIKSLITNGIWWWMASYTFSAYLMKLFVNFIQKNIKKKVPSRTIMDIRRDGQARDAARAAEDRRKMIGYSRLKEVFGSDIAEDSEIERNPEFQVAQILLDLKYPDSFDVNGGKKQTRKRSKKHSNRKRKTRRSG